MTGIPAINIASPADTADSAVVSEMDSLSNTVHGGLPMRRDLSDPRSFCGVLVVLPVGLSSGEDSWDD